MRLVIFQCRPGRADPAENIARVRVAAQRAGAVGAELLVCPELMLSGYNVGADSIRRHAQPRNGIFARAIAEITKRCDIAIAYGYPERDGETLYNAAQLVTRHGLCVLDYRKAHLFGDYEREIFTPGEANNEVVDIGGWKIGLLICYDVEFPEMARALALNDADLIVVPTALMHPYVRIPDVLIPARAYENQVYVAYANYCGEEGTLHYCGKSTLAAPDGRIRLQGGVDETLVIGDVSRGELTASRELNTYLADRRPEIYRALFEPAAVDPA